MKVAVSSDEYRSSIIPASPLDIALGYVRRGWSPVPIPHREKRPTLESWPALRLDADTAARHFNSNPKNIGVILGDASGGLVDIDCDCPEARLIAPRLLPHTDSIFGRKTNSRSHLLYVAPDLITKQIRCPVSQKMLIELRSNTDGLPSQTVFPGSAHKESGELIAWEHNGEPASVNAPDLLVAFNRAGAACILARHFPAEGGRHNATMALFGLLIRGGWTDGEAITFVKAVRDAAKADSKKSLKSMVRDARKRFGADKKLKGLPALRDSFGEKAADRVAELIGYHDTIDYDGLDDADDDDFDSLLATTKSAAANDDDWPDDTPTRLRFLSPEECADAPSRGYVVKGLIAPGDVSCIYGVPGAGKSLISPHIGYAVAQGRTAFGMRTKASRVWYVAAEDSHGLRGRVSALKIRHGDTENFALVDGVSDLLSPDSPDLKALYRAVKEQKPALVFIDTLAMAFPGLEENSAEGMGRVVAVARKLASHGAAVVLIHHDTKSATPTPRGHSLLNGALDMALQLFAQDEHGVVRGKMSKNRNGACDRDIAFRIATEQLGVDEDGDTIVSALVDELDASTASRRAKLTPSERAALTILTDMLEMSGQCPVSESDWRDACIESRTVSASDDRESRRKATKRAFEGLARKKAVRLSDGVATLPGVWADEPTTSGQPDLTDDLDPEPFG